MIAKESRKLENDNKTKEELKASLCQNEKKKVLVSHFYF